MGFRVGQKVVCVDTSPGSRGYVPIELEKGRVYTVAWISDYPDPDGDYGIHLVGIISQPQPLHNSGFKCRRFRPIVERKTDISIFTSMLKPSKVNA